MTQTRFTIIAGGVLFAFAAWCFTPAYPNDSRGQPASDAWHSDRFTAKRMFVGNRDAGEVDTYNRKGNWVLSLAGFDFPFGMDVDAGNLYVVSQHSDEVYVYRHDRTAQRSEQQDEVPQLEVLVERGSGGLQVPFYTTVADGMLYVSSYGTGEILRYDAESGEFIDVAVAAGAGGLEGPRGLDFDSRGRLYVSSSGNNRVIVYSRHGEPLGDLVDEIPTPCGISISRHDEICVGSAGGSGVHCYDPQGNEIYSDTSGGVCGLDFGPRGDLYTTRPDLQAITVHSLRPGTQGEWFTDAATPSGLSWGE